MNDETRQRIKYYTDLTKKKGYNEETSKMGIMLAHTTVAFDKYGSPEAAFEEIIKLCEKNDDGKQFIGDILKLLDIV